LFPATIEATNISPKIVVITIAAITDLRAVPVDETHVKKHHIPPNIVVSSRAAKINPGALWVEPHHAVAVTDATGNPGSPPPRHVAGASAADYGPGFRPF